MKKFEYKVENLRTHGMTTMVLTKDHEEKFNELGEEGWELVGLEKSSRNILAIFKREKID
ncbi:MAG: DUF4177 domain-containing protein [Firmicutes bacterium]|nr:DUF4177 domain-containing protein [Bacillota bacterium]